MAFISYKTNIQRDTVLMAYQKQYEGFCYQCSASPLYKISAAKQPESIIWNSIGHSRMEVIIRACIARPLLLFLTPVFMGGFIAFNVLFTWLHAIIKEEAMVPVLNIGLFLLIKIFTWVTLKVIELLNGFELSLTKNEHASRKVFISAILKIFYLFIGYFFLGVDKVVDEKSNQFLAAFVEISDKALKYIVTSSYLVPTLFIFQVRYLLTAFQRSRVRRALRNAKHTKNGKNDSEYLHMTQGMVNELWERPDIDLDTKYTTLYSLMFLYTQISGSSPLVIPLLLLFVFIVYLFVEQKLIYSRYKKPEYEIRSFERNMIRRLILIVKLISFKAENLPLEGENVVLSGIKMILFNLLPVIVFVNFDFVLNRLERSVERRYMCSPSRTKKLYSDNSPGFDVDYESEYLGLKRSRRAPIEEISEELDHESEDEDDRL